MTDLMRLFAEADAQAPPEPPLPPGYLEASLARARRSARRRRVAGIAVAAVAVLLAVVAVPWPARLLDATPAPAAPTGPTLPTEFPAFTDLTASVVTSPPGRAIALYELGSGELFNSWQTLVAGADHDTYRRVDGLNDGARHVLLSPDGTRVLTFVRPNRFVLLDLITGATTTMDTVSWTSNIGAEPQLLAWSPDSHTVVYAVPAPPPADGRAESSFLGGRPIMDLAVLDLLDGSTRRGADMATAWSAAFSPDGRTLAVQTGPGEAWLTTPEGGQIRPLEVRGRDLIPDVAFSPDGTWLATVSAPGAEKATIGFVDATGARRPPPADLPYETFLGWRSPSSVVVQIGIAEPSVLAEVSLRDGAVTVLSRFSRKQTCEFGLHTCYPYRIQLASGLLTQAGVRPNDPDHGPWPLRVWVWGIVVAVETAGVAMWFGLAVRRRLHRR